MSKSFTINKKYQITRGKLNGYIGTLSCAWFADNIHGDHVLLEVDGVTRLMLDPNDVEMVVEPSEYDLKQVLLSDI